MVVSFLQLHPRIDAMDQAANLGVLLIGGNTQGLVYPLLDVYLGVSTSSF